GVVAGGKVLHHLRDIQRSPTGRREAELLREDFGAGGVEEPERRGAALAADDVLQWRGCAVLRDHHAVAERDDVLADRRERGTAVERLDDRPLHSLLVGHRLVEVDELLDTGERGELHGQLLTLHRRERILVAHLRDEQRKELVLAEDAAGAGGVEGGGRR